MLNEIICWDGRKNKRTNKHKETETNIFFKARCNTLSFYPLSLTKKRWWSLCLYSANLISNKWPCFVYTTRSDMLHLFPVWCACCQEAFPSKNVNYADIYFDVILGDEGPMITILGGIITNMIFVLGVYTFF